MVSKKKKQQTSSYTVAKNKVNEFSSKINISTEQTTQKV